MVMLMSFLTSLRNLLPPTKGQSVRTRLKWLIHYSY